MMDAGSIIVKIKSDLTGFSEGLDKASSKLHNVASGFAKAGAVMTAGVTLPIIAMGVASVKAASDLNETLNKVDEAFKDQADTVKSWAKTSVTSMGLAKQSAMDAASLFGDMGTAMGQNTQQASQMSMGLTQLGADLASFKNIRFEVAQTALAGIYTGETESLKKLGIVMTEANLNEYLKAQGIHKTMQEMTQAEKVQARYNYVMSVTKNAQGDFARTSAGTANQLRIMEERFKELQATIGAKLLPIANKLLEWVGKAFDWFEKLNDGQQNTILVIAGVAAAIGPLLIGLAALTSALSVLAAHPVILIIGAIILALIGVAWVVNEVVKKFGGWSAVFEALKPTFEWFKAVWNNIVTIFNNYVIPAFQMFVAFLQEHLIPPLKELWEKHGPQIIEALKALGIILLIVVGVIIGSVVVSLMILIGIITAVVNVVNWFSNAWNWSITTAANAVKWLAQQTFNAFNWINQQVLNVVNWFRNLVGQIGGILGGVWNAITQPFRQAFDWVKGQVDAVVNKLKSLNPFQRHSPSLFDLISKGNEAIKASYGDMFASVNQMATANPASAIAGGGNPVGGGSVDTRIFGNITIGSEVDADNFLTRLTKNQELANKGLTTNG